MANDKTAQNQDREIKPIIFDDEPYSVLISLQGSGGIKSVDDEKLGENFSCFVLRASVFYGLPSWDKGDPKKGKLPTPDFWTQLLFVPTHSEKADNKLYSKVSDRTVCQIFKRGRHLSGFNAACKTTRSCEELEDMVAGLGMPDLQAWRLVVWTPEFIGKSNEHGSYSALKWWWNLPTGDKQLATYQRVIKMYRDFTVNPLELEYEVDPKLINLDALEVEEKRAFKRMISARNQPSLPEVANALQMPVKTVEQVAEPVTEQ